MTVQRNPTGYIVDTNILSNPADRNHPHVSEWFRRYAGRVCISVITVAEMRRGLMLLGQKTAAIKDRKVWEREQERLDHKVSWYREVLEMLSEQTLPIDMVIAETWADISVRYPSLKDGDKVITATALVKGYGVATRNLRDFRASGVILVNPFDPSTWPDDEEDDPIRRLL